MPPEVHEPLDWRVLNDQTHTASKNGRLVAVLYTVEARDTSGDEWLEFCWLPPDQPGQVDVIFGVGEGAADAWINRWQRARHAVEWLHLDN
jgi:hypothetical protein